MSELTELYLKEKPVKALLMIYNKNGETFCREISEQIDSTYAHTVKIVSKFKDLGVLNTRDRGRKKMLSLTDKGRKQARLLNELVEELSDNDQKQGGKIQDNELFELDK
jgi:DNA-binding MarR family transcriptional regulator